MVSLELFQMDLGRVAGSLQSLLLLDNNHAYRAGQAAVVGATVSNSTHGTPKSSSF